MRPGCSSLNQSSEYGKMNCLRTLKNEYRADCCTRYGDFYMTKKRMGRFSLFGRRKASKNSNGLSRAVAFVDYEHWFISIEKLHSQKPDIQGWFDDLKKRCNIVEVVFFANFSKFKDKETETKRIRTFTNKIIDTYNPDLRYKKDYTDFIILDNIYQKAFQEDSPEMFIIFSGDGHFSSAAAFIRNFCNKQVGIYGVGGCISKSLINSADWCVEVPIEVNETAMIHNAIFTYLKEHEKDEQYFPTFQRTVELIAVGEQMEQEKVSAVLSDLIKDNLITQEMERTNRNRPIRTLKPNWKAVSKSGLWKPRSKIS